MRRSVVLRFDEFGRSTLEAQAERYALAALKFVEHAAVCYPAARGTGRTAYRIPRF